jgi:hypothetical protein
MSSHKVRATVAACALVVVATPAAATVCIAEVIPLLSGGFVVAGATDFYGLARVDVIDPADRVRQSLVVGTRSFAELLDFAIELDTKLKFAFIDERGDTVCVDIAPVEELPRPCWGPLVPVDEARSVPGGRSHAPATTVSARVEP